jgi:glutathione S-transferase
MGTLLSLPAVRLYAASSVALVLGFHGFAFWTGRTRGERKAVVNPEDVKVYKDSVLADIEHADVLRVKRAHLNLIENAVPFFVIAFLYALTNPSVPTAAFLFATFVGTRALHAVFYLTARQPFRAAMFGVGVMVNLIMALQVMRAVFDGG